MATLSVGQKAQRVLRFFMGLRSPRVVQSLASHGFSNDDLNEGWELLRRSSATSLDAVKVGLLTPGSSQALARLDAWENKWFPIASATLARRAPDAQEWLFRNLSQTQGLAVIVSVGTFLRRLDQITQPESEGGLGKRGKAARALLVQRGLTTQAVGQAQALLTELGSVQAEKLDGPSKEEQNAAFAEAEAEMWAWYQEWSSIARFAVEDRVLLRQLGIGRAGRRKGKGTAGGDNVEGDGDGDGEPSGDQTDGTDGEVDDAAE